MKQELKEGQSSVNRVKKGISSAWPAWGLWWKG